MKLVLRYQALSAKANSNQNKAAALGRFNLQTFKESLFRGRGSGAAGFFLGLLAALVVHRFLAGFGRCGLVACRFVCGPATSLCERQGSAEQQCKRDCK